MSDDSHLKIFLRERDDSEMKVKDRYEHGIEAGIRMSCLPCWWVDVKFW